MLVLMVLVVDNACSRSLHRNN